MPNQLQENYINSLTIPIRNLLSYKIGLKKGYVSDLKEHNKNVENLKKNLEPDALKHLEKILHNINLSETQSKIAINEVYDKNEIDICFKEMFLKKRIKNVENYYQYKNYKLPVKHFGAEMFINNCGLDKLKTINNISNDMSIIDAGAYIGDSALILNKFFPNNKIYSFEPIQELYKYISVTAKLNNLYNIIPVNSGVGLKNEMLKIKCIKNNTNDSFTGSSSFFMANTSEPEEKREIEVISIDKYASDNNLKIGLIKSDVEGLELDLLKGSIEIIRRDKPILVISIYHNYHDFYKIKPWIEDLNLGYKFDFVMTKYQKLNIEIVLIAEVR